MITGFFLQIFYAVIAFFIGLLPIIAVPADWANALVLIWGYLQSFSFLFPVAALVSVLSVALTFHLALLSYDLSIKVYHMIRGK